VDKPAVVFGDVHGDLVALQRLVALVREQYGDVDIYSVGDLVDRGPDSRGVLDFCIREGIQGILGNHELWLLDVALRGRMTDGVYSGIMGGLATIKSYGLSRGDPDRVGPALKAAMPESHRQYIENLPEFRQIQVGKQVYWLIHAGLSNDGVAGAIHSGLPVDTDEDLLWAALQTAPDLFFWLPTKVREPRSLYRFRSGAVQILGHVPVPNAVNEQHYIAIDTGCGTCPPWTLTAVVLKPDGDREFVRVSGSRLR